MDFASIYLSRILGNKIYDANNNVIGRLSDLAVTTEPVNPKVVVAKVKTKEGIKYLDWKNFNINKNKNQYVISCNFTKEVNIESYMPLKQYVFDKQIIDVNGRKVVRANDVRLILTNSELVVVAVDIGAEGILRRLGFAKPLKKLGLNIPSRLMLWNDVQTLFTNKDIKLSKPYDKLSVLHASDLADIIEDFDTNSGMVIFSSFDPAKAADILEELEEGVQINLIKSLSPDKAADILEEMPADEVADILDGMDKGKVEELLGNMEKTASDEVRELLEYSEDVVGSIMTTDYITYPRNYTVQEALNKLKELNPPEDQTYSLYVVNDREVLLGTLMLKDLIVSNPICKLETIMNKRYIFMYDTDEIEDLIKDIAKYNLLAMPVINIEKCIVGQVLVNDVLHEVIKNNKRAI